MPSDALHDLIHSLSPNERRYFRLHALPNGAGPESNAMRLYNALLEQPTYDEAALLQHLQGLPMAKYLSSEKNYLYRLLLRSLRHMREEGSQKAEIRADIENAALLYERGLYQQCRKMLQRARKRAFEMQAHLALNEIITWERRLWKILADKGRQPLADRLIREQGQTLAQLQQTQAYYDLYDRMFLLTHRKFSLRDPEKHAEWQSILQDPLLSDPLGATGFEARHFYWLCQAWRHQMEGNIPALYESLRQDVDWWEQHPEILREDTSRYVQTLSNFLHAAGLLLRLEEFPVVLDRLRGIRPRHAHEEMQVRQALLYYELHYALNTADWMAAQASEQAIDALLAEATTQVGMARRLAFHYNLCILSFILEDFKAALRRVNAILDNSGAEVREDIQSFARILLVVIHFEMGHMDLLEYLHRSAYRYLFERAELHPYERLLLDALRRLMQQPEGEARQAVWQGLEAGFEELQRQHGKRPGMEELRCWVMAKRTHRPLREVVAERQRPTP